MWTRTSSSPLIQIFRKILRKEFFQLEITPRVYILEQANSFQNGRIMCAASSLLPSYLKINPLHCPVHNCQFNIQFVSFSLVTSPSKLYVGTPRTNLKSIQKKDSHTLYLSNPCKHCSVDDNDGAHRQRVVFKD